MTKVKKLFDDLFGVFRCGSSHSLQAYSLVSCCIPHQEARDSMDVTKGAPTGDEDLDVPHGDMHGSPHVVPVAHDGGKTIQVPT